MKMWRLIGLIGILALLILAAQPSVAAGLVPCDTNCGVCDLFILAKNVLNFVIEIAFGLGAIFFAWGALTIMTAGGSETKYSEGIKIITSAVYGLLIVLCAWLIVGTVLQFLTGSPSKLPWNEINCSQS